jgi:cell volume regulation protein A
MPASIEIAKQTLLSAGIILAIGTVAGLLARKAKIPDVAVFPIVGIMIGPQALRLVEIKADSALNQVILLFGASYILFDGGASLRLNVLKQTWITILALATVGVVVTAVITGIAAHFVFGMPMIVALLLGATLASTDPATLVPIFQQINIRDRVAQTVVSESASREGYLSPLDSWQNEEPSASSRRGRAASYVHPAMSRVPPTARDTKVL